MVPGGVVILDDHAYGFHWLQAKGPALWQPHKASAASQRGVTLMVNNPVMRSNPAQNAVYSGGYVCGGGMMMAGVEGGRGNNG